MKQLLITGHKGFIGSQLIKYLQEQEYFCVGLDRRSGKDILDEGLSTHNLLDFSETEARLITQEL